jgi:hypothetical protein
MNKQKTNGWKITAVIFIILFVLENVGIVVLMFYVQDDFDREYECVYNVCSGYEAYNYYDFEGLCECYNEGVLEHIEYIE